MCKRKKKERLNNVIRKTGESNKKNKSKKFLMKLNNLHGRTQGSHICAKMIRKLVITQMGQILNRWKEYFCTLLNTEVEGLPDNQKIQPKHTDNQPGIGNPAPSFNEVCSIINKLKSGKAGGTDNITPELIKYERRVLKQRIYNLITMIWEEVQLPSHWNEGIICPVYKKGDRLDCKIYRPITLLNVAYNIFAIILNQRLADIVEPTLGDYQFGFRPNRSTIHNIFTLRQIIKYVTNSTLTLTTYSMTILMLSTP
jgi:hypothetical protein